MLPQKLEMLWSASKFIHFSLFYKKVNVTGWCGGCDIDVINDDDDDEDDDCSDEKFVSWRRLQKLFEFFKYFFVKRRRWMIEADKFLNENTENADYNQVSIWPYCIKVPSFSRVAVIVYINFLIIIFMMLIIMIK